MSSFNRPPYKGFFSRAHTVYSLERVFFLVLKRQSQRAFKSPQFKPAPLKKSLSGEKVATIQKTHMTPSQPKTKQSHRTYHKFFSPQGGSPPKNNPKGGFFTHPKEHTKSTPQKNSPPQFTKVSPPKNKPLFTPARKLYSRVKRRPPPPPPLLFNFPKTPV